MIMKASTSSPTAYPHTEAIAIHDLRWALRCLGPQRRSTSQKDLQQQIEQDSGVLSVLMFEVVGAFRDEEVAIGSGFFGWTV